MPCVLLSCIPQDPPGREPGGAAGGGALTPAKPTGARHRLCTWGEPTRPGVGSLSRKRYTQYVEQIRNGTLRKQSENRKGTYNEGDAVCYGAR
jgi:hypothetical protein